ncbi:hypothetical protein C1S82_20370 [Mycolicibacterium cosmeticum]|nr:hypothetical protein C1S82_20370 [Mycolicibacterium cosmeticum]
MGSVADFENIDKNSRKIVDFKSHIFEHGVVAAILRSRSIAEPPALSGGCKVREIGQHGIERLLIDAVLAHPNDSK